jgi:hypothetical protein
MNNHKLLKVAGVLLLSAVMLLSASAVTANTYQDQLKQKPQSTMGSYTPTNVPTRGVLLTEGFEGGVMPPAGWTNIITNPAWTWVSSTVTFHTGLRGADCQYDPALVPQNEWIITPSMDFRGYTSISLSFWWMMSYYWGVTPYDNYDLNVKISTNGGTTWTLIWNEDTIGAFTTWQWYNTTLGTPIDLAAYIGQASVTIGFSYVGSDGAEIGLDDILIWGEGGGNLPPDTPAAPAGPTSGTAGVSYSFTATTTDPEGDPISYLFTWDDGTDSGWLATGNASHTWTTAGSYDITVKAKDLTGESGVSPAHTIVISAAPTIEIQTITGGLLKVKAVVKNNGAVAATNVSWGIDLAGGIILLGKTSSGTIPTIAANGTATITSKMIVGFGKTVITVTAGTATKSQNATVLLVFIKTA